MEDFKKKKTEYPQEVKKPKVPEALERLRSGMPTKKTSGGWISLKSGKKVTLSKAESAKLTEEDVKKAKNASEKEKEEVRTRYMLDQMDAEDSDSGVAKRYRKYTI